MIEMHDAGTGHEGVMKQQDAETTFYDKSALIDGKLIFSEIRKTLDPYRSSVFLLVGVLL